MKSKSFKYGKQYFKTYCKSVGHGFEVGFEWDKKVLFVGNFIHQKEATKWYGILNKEVLHFSKKYWWNPEATNQFNSFYAKFFTNHLYKMYYGYLDKLFVKYNKEYSRASSRDTKKYMQYKKHFSSYRYYAA